MNLERLNQAIAIMERAGRVDMTDWQSGEIVETESEIHSCGTAACFAGWVAVSPEFKAAGGVTHPVSGAPILNIFSGYLAIVDWLEVVDEKQKDTLELLVAGEGSVLDSSIEWMQAKDLRVEAEKLEPDSEYSYAHLVGWSKYKAQDVIKVLEALRHQIPIR